MERRHRSVVMDRVEGVSEWWENVGREIVVRNRKEPFFTTSK